MSNSAENTQAGLAIVGAGTSLGLGIAGLASGAAAGSALGPIGAIIGGVLGLAGFGVGMGAAKARNRQIRRSLRAKYAQIDEKINESRMGFYDATVRNAKESADLIDKTRVALSGFGSGISNNEYVAQIQADKEYDQMMLRRQLQGVEKQAAYEKEVSYAEARAGAVNPVSQGLILGAQGFQTGMALGGAIESAANSMARNDANKALMAQANYEQRNGGMLPTTEAAVAAVGAGVDPRMVYRQGQVVTDHPAIRTILRQGQLEQAQFRYYQSAAQSSDWAMRMMRESMRANANPYGSPQWFGAARGIATERTNILNQMNPPSPPFQAGYRPPSVFDFLGGPIR